MQKSIFSTPSLSRLIILKLLFIIVPGIVQAQQITGVWKGKRKSEKIELKLIKSADSLVGTAYYYHSRSNYRKYSVKGYFDAATNNVIWWDDKLIEDKGGSGILAHSEHDALLNVADFNCPGEDEMRLDGTSSMRDDMDTDEGAVNLLKTKSAVFSDEWDWVIDNYTVGANHPFVIDSVSRLTAGIKPFPEEKEIAAPGPRPVVSPNKSLSPEEKFAARKKNLQTVIPITGKVIEIKFYDNASIDGDSIAIFLNGKLLQQHILLGGEPQTIKLRAEDLEDDNELVMVAENLGTIPPNTSYMIVNIGNKQYEARLFADENSSALVRFIKQQR